MSLPGRSSNPRSSISSRSHQDQVSVHVERFDYDAEVGDLREQVKKLKQVGLAIHEEAEQQGQLLQELEELFDKAQLNLKRAMRRANQVVQRSNRPHLVYVLLCTACLLLSVYGYRWLQRHPFLKWVMIVSVGLLLCLVIGTRLIRKGKKLMGRSV